MTPSPQPVRVLHLTLKRQWFDMVVTRAKPFEYREIKPYWTKRFFRDGQVIEFDEVHFKNGYSKKAPMARVKWLGLVYADKSPLGDKKVYAIHLGEILEVRR